MIHYNIKFQPYDWDVEVYVIVNNCFIEEILASMKDCPESEIQQAFLNLTTRINSGFIRTFDRRSIIVINKPTTIEEFINVYNHEKNHLEMHICEEFGIDPHSEEAAELSGMLAKCLFNSLFNELLFYYTELNKYR
jgi:hypothetical protein